MKDLGIGMKDLEKKVKKRGRRPPNIQFIPNRPDTIQTRVDWIKWLNDTLTDEEKRSIK